MTTVAIALAVPSGVGVGASAAIGTTLQTKSIVVGAMDGVLIIEARAGAGGWCQVATFLEAGQLDLDFVADAVRVRRQGAVVTGTPLVDISAEAGTALVASLAIPAGLGVGASTNVTAFGEVTTYFFGGAFGGPFVGTVIIVETSPDNVNFGQIGPAMTDPGCFTLSSPHNFVRVRRVAGAGTPTVDLAAVPHSGSAGEVNTASNAGSAGVGVFDGKVAADLEFRNLVAASAQISIVLDGPNKNVDLDVVPGSVDHNALLNAVGTDTHATIDAFIDTFTGAAQGEVWFRNAAGLIALGVGAAGEVLTSGGAGADVSWAAAAGGVSDLQGAYDGGAGVAIVIGTPIDLSIDAAGAVHNAALILSNNTAATAGLDQYPPALRMAGSWWDSTDAHAVAVEQRLFSRTVGGSEAPSVEWWRSVDGGAYAMFFAVEDDLSGGRTQLNTVNGNYWSIGGAVSGRGLTDDQDVALNLLEVNGTAYFEGAITNVYGSFRFNAGADSTFFDNIETRWGNGFDSAIDWSTVQTNDALVWGLGETSKSIIFCDKADTGINFGIANQSNPSVIAMSAARGAGEWGGFQHDGTNMQFITGLGGVHATPVSGVNHDLISGTYGEIYIAVGVTTQVTNGSANTFDLMTGWNTAAGADGLSNGTTPAKASNKITLDKAGRYRVSGAFSFTGSANAIISLQVFVNGVAQPQTMLVRKISTGGDVGRAALTGLITATAGQDLDVRVASDGTSDNFVPTECNLNVSWIGV